MSYTDLLQSYQDRLSSMVQNEESIGDYLLNKSQEKINSYLEQVGIPGQVGGVLDQVGILANNSAVKTLVEKSGLKGVVDEQLETLNRTVGDLKGQIKMFGEKASAAVDTQIAKAQTAARPLLERTQQAIDTGRAAETQVREGIETARALPAQAQAQAEAAVGQARGAAEQAVGQARGAAEEGMAQLRGTAEDLTERVPTLDEALAQIGTRARPPILPENIPESGGELVQGDILGQITSRYYGGVPPREATQGVVEEPNVRPSQVARDLPEFQTPTQQLPQVPQATPQPPAAPQPAQATQPPATETPQPTRPTGYEPPEEMIERAPPSGEMQQLGTIAKEGEELTSIGTEAQKIIPTVAKVGTGLEETTGELPGIGEIGEVFGALLQIGSLIASAFKPHEDVQTITTPISGFGFGAMNQFGVGGSSIV